MLSKVFEWYRIVHPDPKDDLVAKRTATVTKLVGESKLDISDLVSAIVHGLEGQFDQESQLVAALVEAIRAEQPAFPQSLKENAVDLRVCAALMIGELLARATKGAVTQNQQFAAALMAAGLLHKPISAPNRLKGMLSELAELSLAVLQQAGGRRRKRTSAIPDLEKVQEAGDVPAFWKGASPQLKKVVTTIEANAALDREELNALWWVYDGFSEVLEKPFADMPIGAAAICCGGELADLCELPPFPRMRRLVNRVVEAGRQSSDLKPITLKQCVDMWDPSVVSLLTPENDSTVELVRENAAVFPLSWCSIRFSEAEGQTNWVGEVKKITGWDTSAKLSPAIFAAQAFSERVAQRLHERLK